MNTGYKKIIISVFILFFSCKVVFGEQIFSRTLQVGDVGSDVLSLQQVLNNDGDTLVDSTGVGSPNNETNYFGLKTKNAVIRFQEKYRDEILTPLGLSSGTGIVGQKTLNKLNALVGSGIGQSNNAVNENEVKTNTALDENKVVSYEGADSYKNDYQDVLPRILAVNPIIILDPKNTKVTISGINFDKNSKVFLLTSGIELFDSVEVNSQGTELKVNLSTVLEDNLENVLNNSTNDNKALIIDGLKSRYETYNNYGIFINAKLFVENNIGSSNTFPIKINIYRNDPTLPQN